MRLITGAVIGAGDINVSGTYRQKKRGRHMRLSRETPQALVGSVAGIMSEQGTE